MLSRCRLMVVALLALLAVGLVVPSGASASPGGGSGLRANQPFALSLVEGQILIRDAEEAYPLEAPTTVSGQHDTGDDGEGAVSSGVFTSPPISFETEALGNPVYVDATFSQVTPGSGTGSIDADGNVSFRTDITVDLHIEVNNPPALVQECRATPVSIALDSTAPWNPDTKQVTLRDADFSVPPVPSNETTCISLVAGNVNTLLSGGGHSLTMTMEGDLTLPPPKGCPTTTALEMAPARTFLGDGVTLDATVTPDPDDSPECDEAEGQTPAGTVEFLAGGTQIGVSELDGSGVAQLVTGALPTGTHALTAKYRPTPPYSGSTSTAVSHTVVARPTISIDAPPAFTIGAAPVEFAVEVANSGAGQVVENGRLDATFVSTTALLGDLVLERWDGASWVVVPLTGFGNQVFGAAQPAGGVALPLGASFTQRYRLSATPAQVPTAVSIVFELVPVDPDAAPPEAVRAPAPDALARAQVDAAVTTAPRRDPVMDMTTVPHTLRQGMVVQAQTLLTRPPEGGPFPSGTFTVLLDGQQVPIRGTRTPPELGYQLSMAVSDAIGGLSPKFELPPDTPTGTRQVTVKYSGDAFYKPAQRTSTITVLPSRGVTFACTSASIVATDLFNVQVEVAGNLPAAVRAGQPVSVGQLDVEVFADRGDATGFGSFFFGPTPVVTPESGLDGFTVADLRFGSLGTATPTEVTFANNFQMGDSTRPVDPAPDMEISFTGEENAELTFTGAPGTLVPVALDGIELSASFFGGFLTLPLSCVPLDEPAVLRTVTIAGTTLTVEADRPTREGDPVTLTAVAAPVGTPGVVEFRDGATTLAVVPVDSTGTATHLVSSLAPGDHSFTARFTTSVAGVNSVSAAVPLTVLEEYECEAFAEDGNGAIVRLVYLELLWRCPDQAGFDYWVGRLDGGTTPEVFARTIAATPEAVGVVVDDAYQTMLGRPADASGRAYWVNRMRTGTGRYDQLLADLGASNEFWILSGSTNAGFVTRVYERLLQRSPDQGGLDFWVGRLDAGTPRGTLILQLANLDEPLGALVVASYDEILSRPPSSSERGDGIDHLRSTGDRSGLYAQLIGRPEFSTRAGTFPNPED